jgi:hypothetical protein
MGGVARCDMMKEPPTPRPPNPSTVGRIEPDVQLPRPRAMVPDAGGDYNSFK